MRSCVKTRTYINSIFARSSIVFMLLFTNIFIFIQLIGDALKMQLRDYQSYVGGDINPEVLQIYKERIEERKLLLNGTYPSEYLALTNRFSLGILYTVLAPEVYCKDILKIGRVFDGGKWLCNPLRIKSFDKCTIYSLGLNNEMSFEEHMYKISNNKCRIRAFDQSDQTYETSSRLANINATFIRARIGEVSNPSNHEYKIEDILKIYNDKHIEILKVDIEGFENLVIDKLNLISTCQILIEIHGKVNGMENGKVVVKPHFDADQILEIIRKISRHGFYIFSYELNIWLHEVAEYSFIHESCLEKYGLKTVLGKYLS